ncbi:MAG: hypothetical protein KAI47_03815 [Deltaproteobacteria bacterium]|nr:hypothetical protein [Deltaproteobacteria bacterium]
MSRRIAGMGPIPTEKHQDLTAVGLDEPRGLLGATSAQSSPSAPPLLGTGASEAVSHHYTALI